VYLKRIALLFDISVAPYNWDPKDMASAVTAVNSGMSVRRAAKEYNVPKSSLSDRVTGKVKHGATWGKKPKMSSTDEKALIEAATSRAARGLGFSKGNFLEIMLYIVFVLSLKTQIFNLQLVFDT